MTFTPIETQEQLDKVIGERINFAKEKARAELEEKYKGYVSPDDYTKKIEEINAQITSSNTSLEEANKKLEDASKENAELKGKIGVYEANSVKTRIALEEGGLHFEEHYKATSQFGLETLELFGGGRVNFRTRSSKGGLGEGYDLLVIDEAQEYTDYGTTTVKWGR